MGSGGHHQPIHRLPLGSRSGSLPSSFRSCLPPNLLLAATAAAAAAPLAAGEGPRGQLRARLVLGWRREKEGREAVSERRLAGSEREGGRKAEGYSGRTSPRRHRAPRRLAAAVAMRSPLLAKQSALKDRPASIRPLVSSPGLVGRASGMGCVDWPRAGESWVLIGLAW